MSDSEHKIELNVAEDVAERHRLDNLTLLIDVSLLILTIITVWLFKHLKNRYMHESGLAMIYGLIIGLIIWTSRAKSEMDTVIVSMDQPNNSYTSDYKLPQSIFLKVCSPLINNSCEATKGSFFEYTFKTSVQKRLQVDNGEQSSELALESMSTFDPEVFFNIILPPIIFNAGYSLKKRYFFANFGAILTYALAGTVISTFTIASIMYLVCSIFITYLHFTFTDCVMFGAIISATDPVTVLAIFNDLKVDSDLNALIFGESVLNDAVAIVLSVAVLNYRQSAIDHTEFDIAAIMSAFGNFLGVFAGATAIGVFVGIMTAVLTKFTLIRDYPLLETSLFMLMSYATFLAAEAAELTGIVAVLFCGITQAHYTYNNLSGHSKFTTREVMELMAFLAENFCFVYIGVTIFTFQYHYWNAGFILTSLLAIAAARALNIYPLSFIINRLRNNKIPLKFQHMMFFSGLRGAMAFALAIRDTASSQRQVMFSTTLVIVMITVILCGIGVTPAMNRLKIKTGVVEPQPTAAEGVKRSYSALEVTQSGDEASGSQDSGCGVPREPVDTNEAWLLNKFLSLDSLLLSPIFTHARPLLADTLPKNAFCQWIARTLTTKQQYALGSKDGEVRDIEEERDEPSPQQNGTSSPVPGDFSAI